MQWDARKDFEWHRSFACVPHVIEGKAYWWVWLERKCTYDFPPQDAMHGATERWDYRLPAREEA